MSKYQLLRDFILNTGFQRLPIDYKYFILEAIIRSNAWQHSEYGEQFRDFMLGEGYQQLTFFAKAGFLAAIISSDAWHHPQYGELFINFIRRESRMFTDSSLGDGYHLERIMRDHNFPMT